MKRLLVHSACLALFTLTIGCTPSPAQNDLRIARNSPGDPIGVSYFYEALSPSGEWINEPDYGWCWTPYDMDAGWRPYSNGRWEYTDYGWSWASNESWGWATDHYGRWFFDDSYGWVWVPGTEWAPAWVAWRYGDDYVGWAPLPPAAVWNGSIGLSFGDADRIPSQHWCFVPRRHLLDPNIRLQVTLVSRNPTMLARSHDATRFEVRNGRPANIGPDVDQAGAFVGHRVPVVKIVDVGSPARGSGRPVVGGVGFYRPIVRPMPAGQAPAPVARRNPVSAQVLQRQQATQQRKLENDLNAEHKRLETVQRNELRAPAARPAAVDMRQQHAAEQQAFQAHATQQRQVLAQRMQKQIVKPGKPERGKPAPADDNSRPRDAGKGDSGDKRGK